MTARTGFACLVIGDTIGAVMSAGDWHVTVAMWIGVLFGGGFMWVNEAVERGRETRP